MKKISIFLAIVFSMCIFTSCQNNDVKNSGDINLTLAKKGLEYTQKIDGLTENTDYINIFTYSKELTDIISDISSKDYLKPKAIFKVENFDTAVYNTMSQHFSTDFPDDIKAILTERLCSAFPTQINAQKGANVLAATSVATYADSFILEGVETPLLFIYVYEDGYNSSVIFYPKKENIITATANFVVSENLSEVTTEDELADFFLKTAFINELDIKKIEI